MRDAMALLRRYTPGLTAKWFGTGLRRRKARANTSAATPAAAAAGGPGLAVADGTAGVVAGGQPVS